MLINCPRCGLSQPKDRYCAKCGVDMDSFRPAEPSAVKKFLFNPLLHVGVIAILVSATIVVIRQKQREELKSRMEYLNAGPIVVDRLPSEPAQDQSSVGQNQAEVTNSDLANESMGSLTPPTGSTTPTPSTLPSSGNLNNPSENPAARGGALQRPQLQRALMTYAEVERAVVTSWLREMQDQGSIKMFDGVSMGVLQNIQQKLRTAGVKIHQQMEHPLKGPQVNHDWFVGTHRAGDLDNEIGFFSSLSVVDQRDGLARGDLEIQRAFRDPTDLSKAMERVSYGGPFELPAGAGFVMRGLLPSRFAMELDDEANPDSFLAIFKSRKFMTEETEFIFILDFDTNTPTNK